MDTRRSFRPDLEVWWLNPAWLVGLMGAVLIPAAYLIPDWMYREYWRTPKQFDGTALNLCFLCVAVFAAGAFVGSTRPHEAVPDRRTAWVEDLPWTLLFRVFRWSFYLTLMGYAVWFASAISRGLTLGSVIGVLRGEPGETVLVKEVYMVTISGITTLTQFGQVVLVLGVLIGCVWGWRPVRFQLAAVFGLALIRALLNSERLAVIELAVPFAVLIIRLLILDSPRMLGLIRLLVVSAPLYAAGLLLGIFAASEYFRTWINVYAAAGKFTFLQFASLRLLGYYTTALNNGALMASHIAPTGAPFFTLHFLWRFPILSHIVTALYPNLPFTEDENDLFSLLLFKGGNPEFTNPDGYLMPMVDYGFFGALLYWLAIGFICGYLYRLFCRKHVLGLTMYPIVFIGVIEMPRIIYWGEGRVFLGFVTLALLSYACVRSRSRLQEQRYLESVHA